MDKFQWILKTHVDRPQHRVMKRIKKIKKAGLAPLTDSCAYLSVIQSDHDSSDSDLEEHLKMVERQKEMIRMIEHGSLLPKELAFLNFTIDDQVEQFWL